MPRFMMNLIGDESFMEDASPELMEEIVEAMDGYNKQLEEAGVFVSGDGLAPSSQTKTLRYGAEGDVVVTDGPFAETKEQLAGFYIIECASLEEAVSWAERIPAKGGSVEVRPIVETAEENYELFQEQAEK